MLLVSLLVVATLHVVVTAPIPVGDGHRIGDVWHFDGRIDRIDRADADAAQSAAVVWVRLSKDQPIRVVVALMPMDMSVGDDVHVQGVRGEQYSAAARDGQIHQYFVVDDGVLSAANSVAGSWAWTVVVLPVLLGVCLLAALNIGRYQRRPRILQGGADMGDSADWQPLEYLESGDLPVDPIEALAELARRTDEDHT
jgi:hypothetical protein